MVGAVEGSVVIVTPRGQAKFKANGLPRSFIAKCIFRDWREKNIGDYPEIIISKLSQEDYSKLPVVIDEHMQKAKIIDIINDECECWIEGIQQDVGFMIEKYWNKLN